MTNPFEDSEGRYFVLLNEEGQYSLWPAFVDVPAGWEKVHGESDKAACLDYIERSWADMRPKSLVADMGRE